VNGIAHWDGATWNNLDEGVTLPSDSEAVVKAGAFNATGQVSVGRPIDQVGG
jgi:hypothetical protein